MMSHICELCLRYADAISDRTDSISSLMDFVLKSMDTAVV